MTLGVVSTGVAVVALASRFAVGLIFVGAGVEKLFDLPEFERAVADYQLLPRGLNHVMARALPVIELLCGAALLVGLLAPVAGLVAAICLLGFSVAAAINLARGRAIDCGCGGAAASRQIGWDLVAGDVLLAAAALFAGVLNVNALEPTSAPHLLSHAAPFGAAESIAIFVVVAIGVLFRGLAMGYFHLRAVIKWASTTTQRGLPQ